MTHDTQGRHWPPTVGCETSSTPAYDSGSRRPPFLEGWSFCVCSGKEEHASGWGFVSLADMAPALLATVGMTNVTTANKRAAQLANDLAATRETLDAANDTLGKMCLALSKAGLTGDALAGVQRLVAERDLARQECKDLSSSLDWWEALARRHLWPNLPLATDKTDRHFDLRSALNDRLNTLTTERDTHARAAEAAEMQLREVSRLLGPRRPGALAEQVARLREAADIARSAARRAGLARSTPEICAEAIASLREIVALVRDA